MKATLRIIALLSIVASAWATPVAEVQGRAPGVEVVSVAVRSPEPVYPAVALAARGVDFVKRDDESIIQAVIDTLKILVTEVAAAVTASGTGDATAVGVAIDTLVAAINAHVIILDEVLSVAMTSPTDAITVKDVHSISRLTFRVIDSSVKGSVAALRRVPGSVTVAARAALAGAITGLLEVIKKFPSNVSYMVMEYLTSAEMYQGLLTVAAA